jgi:hypothetical protein
MIRATVSVGPPEGKGTISLTGLSGQASTACAATKFGASITAAAIRKIQRWKAMIIYEFPDFL